MSRRIANEPVGPASPISTSTSLSTFFALPRSVTGSAAGWRGAPRSAPGRVNTRRVLKSWPHPASPSSAEEGFMDFSLSVEIESLRERVRAFVTQHIIPLESDRANFDAHENIAPAALERLRAEVKAAGLWAPQIAREHGGLGLPYIGVAAL